MANIVPQIPYVNREMWTDVEKYARRKAVDLGVLNVINVVKYNPKRSRRIGKNRVAVAKGFYKVLYNEDENFEECYYYENKEYDKEIKDRLSFHLVACSSVQFN
jgi:DNA/RNA endonuclease G (NUC1)